MNISATPQSTAQRASFGSIPTTPGASEDWRFGLIFLKNLSCAELKILLLPIFRVWILLGPLMNQWSRPHPCLFQICLLSHISIHPLTTPQGGGGPNAASIMLSQGWPCRTLRGKGSPNRSNDQSITYVNCVVNECVNRWVVWLKKKWLNEWFFG